MTTMMNTTWLLLVLACTFINTKAKCLASDIEVKGSPDEMPIFNETVHVLPLKSEDQKFNAFTLHFTNEGPGMTVFTFNIMEAMKYAEKKYNLAPKYKATNAHTGHIQGTFTLSENVKLFLTGWANFRWNYQPVAA